MSTTIDELNMTIVTLDTRLKEISDRVSALEQGGGKRHTHSTNACFEDSIAICADIIMEEEKQREYTRLRLNQLLLILQEGRHGPNAYDPDRPSGKRISRND